MKYFNKINGLFILLLISFGSKSYAALNLELTQGVNAALPIVIFPFTQQSPSPSETSVSSVISADLSNSGRFNVLPVSANNPIPQQVNQVDFPFWAKKGADNIVIGQVAPLAFDRLQVSFSLLNVYLNSGPAPSAPENRVLVSETFTIPAKEARRLAHHISDIIYQQLTGVRGVFSTSIAYVLMTKPPKERKKYALQVSDYDGYNPQSLLMSTFPLMSLAWSPDGKKIAYVSFENDRASIYVSDLATGARQLISDFPGINGAPAWSPDGKKLVVVLSKSGSAHLYRYDFTSKQFTQLTQGWFADTEPSFAPDGQSIVFTSDRGGAPQIYQLDLATNVITRLTFDGNYNARPSLTPDGKRLVVLHQANNMYDIAVQDMTTGFMQVLTNSGNDTSPSVAPNGRLIIYSTLYGGRQVLGIVSMDGAVKLRLPAQEGDVKDPAWGPHL